MKISKRFLQLFYGIRPPNTGSDAPFIRINLPDKMANPWRHITRDTPTLLQTSKQPYRKKKEGALTSHYPIAVPRPLISENIKTAQDAINLLGKLDALEARDDYRNPRQKSDSLYASRRPQYNSPGDRTDTYWRDSIGVRYVQYVEVSNYDRQRAYGSPNRRYKRGRDDSGWGEQEGRRHSRRKHQNSRVRASAS